MLQCQQKWRVSNAFSSISFFYVFLFLMLHFHLSSFSRSCLKISQSPHLLFLSFCVYCRRFPMLTLRCHFTFSGYTTISHSSYIPVAWFRVSFLSREKKTWKTMCWYCCSMLWKTSGSFWCLLCCSCSCLSHHWLPSTVPTYMHKRTLRKFSFSFCLLFIHPVDVLKPFYLSHFSLN